MDTSLAWLSDILDAPLDESDCRDGFVFVQLVGIIAPAALDLTSIIVSNQPANYWKLLLDTAKSDLSVAEKLQWSHDVEAAVMKALSCQVKNASSKEWLAILVPLSNHFRGLLSLNVPVTEARTLEQDKKAVSQDIYEATQSEPTECHLVQTLAQSCESSNALDHQAQAPPFDPACIRDPNFLYQCIQLLVLCAKSVHPQSKVYGEVERLLVAACQAAEPLSIPSDMPIVLANGHLYNLVSKQLFPKQFEFPLVSSLYQTPPSSAFTVVVNVPSQLEPEDFHPLVANTLLSRQVSHLTASLFPRVEAYLRSHPRFVPDLHTPFDLEDALLIWLQLSQPDKGDDLSDLFVDIVQPGVWTNLIQSCAELQIHDLKRLGVTLPACTRTTSGKPLVMLAMVALFEAHTAATLKQQKPHKVRVKRSQLSAVPRAEAEAAVNNPLKSPRPADSAISVRAVASPNATQEWVAPCSEEQAARQTSPMPSVSPVALSDTLGTNYSTESPLEQDMQVIVTQNSLAMPPVESPVTCLERNLMPLPMTAADCDSVALPVPRKRALWQPPSSPFPTQMSQEVSTQNSELPIDSNPSQKDDSGEHDDLEDLLNLYGDDTGDQSQEERGSVAHSPCKATRQLLGSTAPSTRAVSPQIQDGSHEGYEAVHSPPHSAGSLPDALFFLKNQAIESDKDGQQPTWEPGPVTPRRSHSPFHDRIDSTGSETDLAHQTSADDLRHDVHDGEAVSQVASPPRPITMVFENDNYNPSRASSKQRQLQSRLASPEPQLAATGRGRNMSGKTVRSAKRSPVTNPKSDTRRASSASSVAAESIKERQRRIIEERQERRSLAKDKNIIRRNVHASSNSASKRHNKKLIINALQACLAGGVNASIRTEVLEDLERSGGDNFVIALRGAQNHGFKALYTHLVGEGQLVKVYGQGPLEVTAEEITDYFKYDSGARAFKTIHTRSLSAFVHGVVVNEGPSGNASAAAGRSKRSG